MPIFNGLIIIGIIIWITKYFNILVNFDVKKFSLGVAKCIILIHIFGGK